jgi:hypothetical protein
VDHKAVITVLVETAESLLSKPKIDLALRFTKRPPHLQRNRLCELVALLMHDDSECGLLRRRRHVFVLTSEDLVANLYDEVVALVVYRSRLCRSFSFPSSSGLIQ